MASGPKLVHKQFNSPIGLYSKQNIEETLNKHIHNLDNGATGIDFSDPATGKPANLANSAVLRMLEEEERSRHGYPSQRKVVWPPVPETNGYHQPASQEQSTPAYRTQTPQQSQYSQPQYQQSSPSQQYSAPHQQNLPHQQQYSTPQQQYSAPQQQYSSPQPQKSPQQYPQSQPAHSEGLRQQQAAIHRLVPIQINSSPYKKGPVSPQASPRSPASQRWAPVTSPTSPQISPNYQQQSHVSQQYSTTTQQYSQQQYSDPYQQYSTSQQQYSTNQQFSPQPQYSPQQYQPPQPKFEPPPSTVTLRPHPPIHQRPSPVFSSQPAAASFQGGANMRGDMKWPPQSVKDAVAAENEARRELAKGPACRPRKVHRDYTAFFAQNALNSAYPGYRVPPGTQHVEDHSGRTSY